MTPDVRAASPLNEESLVDYSDDALAEIALSMREEAKRLGRTAQMAMFELQRRLYESAATVLDTEHFQGTLLAGDWEIVAEDKLLLGLKDMVPPAELARAHRSEQRIIWKWDHRALNELRKRGGRLMELIDSCRGRGAGRLEIARKEEAAE